MNEEIKSTHNSDDSISFKSKNSVDDKFLNVKTEIESNHLMKKISSWISRRINEIYYNHCQNKD